MPMPSPKKFSAVSIKPAFNWTRYAWQDLGFRSKLSVLLYSVALFSVVIIGFYGYQHASHAYRSRATDLIDNSASEVAIKIQDFLEVGTNDLQFLNDFYALRRYLYWRDIGDERQMDYWQTITLDTWRNYSSSYDYIYKVRWLDNDGREKLGVRRDFINQGVTRIMKPSEMRNQSETEYFKATQKLNKDSDIYISELSLNREQGAIERPLNPVVRFATPIIAENGVRYGMIVYNLAATRFFEFIGLANKNNQGRTFYLIDQQGQFLYHPDSDKTFGNILGHGANFEQFYPNVLAKALENKGTGIINTKSDIIAYHPIYYNLANRDNYWILIGVTSENAALTELNNFISFFTLLFIGIVLLVVSANRYMLKQIVRPLQFVTQQLQRLSLGVAEPESLFYPAEDEIHQMLSSCERVVANIRSMTRQVDGIAEGNFSETVEPLSEQDRLSRAINNMTAMLRLNRSSEELRNWHNEGLAQLSKLLTSAMSPQALADTSITQIGRYLAAGRGVFYSWDDTTQSLLLLGSYMHHEREHLGATVKLGEGAIGQVAREKKPIALHLETSLATTDHFPIVTGTVSKLPHYTYTWPLLREDELHGVIEIATIAPLNDGQSAYLQAAAEIVATFLYTSQQQSRIQELLVIAERSAAESQAQSKRLQETNAQMEEQQQQLQQQAEELQQTNAQMEEQQQQLQQQAEELRQSNAQMEETQQQLEQQNRRLVESQQELDLRAKQLELSSQYKSEFLSNMSHELRTPLNSIILLSKMMAGNSEKHLSENEVRHAEIIHNAGQELLRLINDVLDLSKIEAGRMELHISTVASKDLLAELHGLFEQAAKEKNLEFKVDDKLHGAFVSDMDRLSQILRNLLSNAFKFTKTGSISLTIERRSDALLPIRITVKDTGIGIAEEKRKVIFEAFQQADGSISRQFGGTGLGLSISLRFAQLLGGTIELSSTVGQGSEFSLLLPETLAASPPSPVKPVTRFASPEPREYHLATPAIPDDREQLSPQDSVILLIDDDPLFGQALLEINHKLGYKTLLAMTGNDGLALARRYLPNGILLDLGLPDIDGTAVLNELKTQADLADIPVYVVSAREKDAALSQQDLLGYLQKPVDAQQLGKAEAELVAFIRQSVAAQTILVVENGGVTADQVSNIVDPQLATVLKASPDADLGRLLSEHSCCLAIIDLDGQAVSPALDVAKRLRNIDANLSIVFYGQQPLTDEDEAKMHQYSDSIIIKAAQSEQRLLKNIERFLAQASQSPADSSLNVVEDKTGGKRLDGRHILVVDDDARNLFVITAALEKQGAKVTGVLSGKRAQEFLQKQSVAMIFLDIMMPEMDGYQTLTAIRNNPELAKIPVVALTAKALSTDREKILAAGADDYLAKPVNYDDLIDMATLWCAKQHQ